MICAWWAYLRFGCTGGLPEAPSRACQIWLSSLLASAISLLSGGSPKVREADFPQSRLKLQLLLCFALLLLLTILLMDIGYPSATTTTTTCYANMHILF